MSSGPSQFKLTNNIPLVKACNSIMPTHCCQQVLTDMLNLSIEDPVTIQCLTAASTKLLGYFIIIASSMIKLPQLMKILSAQSASGLSFSGTLLELIAITFTAAYSFAKRFPFSAWGEAVFLYVETALIAFFTLWFNRNRIGSIVFICLFSAITFVLGSGLLTPAQLWYLQACNVPLAVGGKLIQARVNFSNQHTGHLSFITAFLLFIGCLVRILTSIQETGDKVVITTYAAASLANLMIVLQILYYWSATNRFVKKEENKKTD